MGATLIQMTTAIVAGIICSVFLQCIPLYLVMLLAVVNIIVITVRLIPSHTISLSL